MGTVAASMKGCWRGPAAAGRVQGGVCPCCSNREDVRFIFKPTTLKRANQPPPQRKKATVWVLAANGLNVKQEAESQPRAAPRTHGWKEEQLTAPQPDLPAPAGHAATMPFTRQRDGSSSAGA